jgi:hypothetical protein
MEQDDYIDVKFGFSIMDSEGYEEEIENWVKDKLKCKDYYSDEELYEEVDELVTEWLHENAPNSRTINPSINIYNI